MSNDNIESYIRENLHHYYADEDYVEAWEIVAIMLSIFDKDITIPQPNKKYNEDLSRKIEVSVPIHRIELWRELIPKLEELANWVSGDKYKIHFNKIEITNYSNLLIPEEQVEIVTLFSGGLDSFSGAYYNYVNNIDSDYIGYINKKEEGAIQKELAKFYRKKFPNRFTGFSAKYDKKKDIPSQATRSLLYLSLAVARAISCGAKEVRMYENGIMTLNPSLGSRYTTKTTHPKTIYLFNEILKNSGYEIEVKNYFEYKTKGEIIDDMSDEFKQHIVQTFTCGKGRSPKTENHKGQCGICIPCILRKISLAAYDNHKFDVVYDTPYDLRSSVHKEKAKEYRVNVSYFQKYAQLIHSKEIFNFINQNKPEYHNEAKYLELQNKMFKKFAEEVERFCEKYGFK